MNTNLLLEKTSSHPAECFASNYGNSGIYGNHGNALPNAIMESQRNSGE
jgi:hypothetical protein